MQTRMIDRGLAVLFCVAFFAGCGGPQNVDSHCVTDYDQCINACAYQCEDGGIDIEPAFSDQNTTLTTWDAACQRCTSQCDHVADSCADRASDEELDDM